MTMTTTVEPASLLPPLPLQPADTGLSPDLIFQTVAKTLHLAGELVGTALADRLGVPFPVIEPALMLLKREQQVEIAGGAMLGPSSYRYRLTDAGRVRAQLFLSNNHYIGALPVPLEQYSAFIKRAAAVHVPLSRDVIRRAFSHLVLSPRVIDHLGPAIAARHSLFVYGPPGNGKTVISQAIRNVSAGDMVVPHAISVDGNIIRVYDPVYHERIDDEAPSTGLARNESFDQRWVRCRRPLVTAGGELTLDALDLGYTPSTGFYRAPLQMIANGGVLVIDDFGRQHATPRDLLNRWIVPLESRVDYLSLQSGQKFEVPFDVFVVFATNLRPADLVDEAFLRRIRYKVLAVSPTREEFLQIFEGCCHERQLPYDRDVAEHLVEKEIQARNVALRGCQPRDLIDQAMAIAAYESQPRRLTTELLSAACLSYFVEDEDLATA
jgi:predicted ATPase with chaperone activity